MPIFIIVIGAGYKGKTKSINKVHQVVSNSTEPLSGNISEMTIYKNKKIAFVSAGDNFEEVKAIEKYLYDADIIVGACRPHNGTKEQVIEYAGENITFWIAKPQSEERLHEKHILEAATHIQCIIDAYCPPPSIFAT